MLEFKKLGLSEFDLVYSLIGIVNIGGALNSGEIQGMGVLIQNQNLK